ncbi:GNAT family N-acetyltransferase [Trueperella pyogenes]|uniref:GNAT family N-acetyltransferase n=1 Tax=Trueperella pyogenes TaxID=1661 RepID=UPI00345CCCA6
MLTLRPPQLEDEQEVTRLAALQEIDHFAHLAGGKPYPEMLQTWQREARGITDPGRVQADILLAVVDDEIVGTLSVRHVLNDYLFEFGGHIGYWVAPVHRHKGYASRMLRAGLERLKEVGVDRALLTCVTTNIPSIRVIEGVGGVLDDVRESPNHEAIRRYWIDCTQI